MNLFYQCTPIRVISVSSFLPCVLGHPQLARRPCSLHRLLCPRVVADHWASTWQPVPGGVPEGLVLGQHPL